MQPTIHTWFQKHHMQYLFMMPKRPHFWPNPKAVSFMDKNYCKMHCNKLNEIVNIFNK